MYHRKLSALNHPAPEHVNVNEVKEFRSLILWLEDQKIRHYKIPDREGLRQIESNDWPKSFHQYLKDLACPLTTDNQIEQLEWLMSYAVRLEYADNVEKYSKSCNVKKPTSTPNVVSTNPLDNLDFNCQEFKNGVEALAKILNISLHPDHLITLKAISKVVSSRLSPKALENPASIIVKGVPVTLDQANLGLDQNDYVLGQASKILRLLYIQNLRSLQTSINETIVAVQTVTANPKTDTRLGKVGI